MRASRFLPALALAAMLAATVGCGAAPVPVSDKVQQAYDSGKALAAPATSKPRTSVADSIAKLASGAEWTLTVLGDSTGNEPGEWVYLLGEYIGGKYQRPVTVYNWDDKASKYDAGTLITQGPGAPVKIWNGSAPGKNADYSLQHLADLAPSPADLVVINHGHNYQTPATAVQGIKTLILAASRTSENAAFVVTVQNPWKVPTESSTGVQDAIKKEFTGPANGLIDVMAAFKENADPASLIKDDIHPNALGETLWAETAKKALGL